MTIEDFNEIHVGNDQGIDEVQLQEYHVKDILARPWIVVLLLASVSLLIGAAIRLTRVSLATDELLKVEQVEEKDRPNICKRCCTKSAFFGKSNFWLKLPRRAWNFYIECFLVPAYRKEWNKYQAWNYRVPRRSPTVTRKNYIITKKDKRDSQQNQSAPHPVAHEHAGCARIRINVGGVPFETQLRTLERFPNTLLGNTKKRLPYFNPNTGEYYFDRCRTTFEVILYFYQSGGRFKRPDNVPVDILLEDALFFQLGETVINQYRREEGLQLKSVKQEVLPFGLLKRKIWLLFEFPESSPQAHIVTFLSTFALFVSIVDLCVETIPLFYLKASYGVKPDGSVMVVEYDTTTPADTFIFVEIACNFWFIFEYLARLCACPITFYFLSSVLNIIDLVALLPFILTSAVPLISKLAGTPKKMDAISIQDNGGMTRVDYLYLLRVVRIIRVFRIFKLSRHFKGLKILGKTMRASLNELMLLIFFIGLGVILFSSTIYFAELDNEATQFHSIPGGFWWALITLTTVGYGDYVPKSPSGKVVGSLCAVAGVLVIALPVPVIVSNFNYFYHQSIDEHDLHWININHVAACPFRAEEFEKEKPDEFQISTPDQKEKV